MAATVTPIKPATPGQLVAGTGAVLSDRIVVEMDDNIWLLEPDAAPLTVFMRKMGSGTVTENPTFNWLEDTLAPKLVTVNTDPTTGATLVLSSGDGTKVVANDILFDPASGEHMLVTVVSTDTLTVTRGYGSTAAASSIAVGQVLMILGNAYAEGATLAAIVTTQQVLKSNYTQITRTPFGASNTLMNTAVYGPNYMTHEQKKQRINHQVSLERTALLGEKKLDTSAAARRTTGGLKEFLTSNVIAAGGALTYPGLVDAMKTVTRYGNRTMRFGLAAPDVCSALDIIAYNRPGTIQQQNSEALGIAIKRIESSHGTIMIAKHNLLGDVSAYQGHLYLLDMDTIERRPMKGRDTALLTNRQENDRDGVVYELRTEIGWQIANEECSGVMTGIVPA